MGMRKEIKRAIKTEMRAIEKSALSNPVDDITMLRWEKLNTLLQSYRNTK